jgi:hypothetical protein
METKNVAEIIEEIHETFYTEVNRLLAEARIFNNVESDKQYLIDKSERLRTLGFTNTKEIEIADKEIKKLTKFKEENKEKQSLIDAINYFNLRYPNRKFITEESVKKICEKYNLVYGEVSRYMGVVPTPNLKEIEAFKLKDEDRCYEKITTHRRSFKRPETTYVGTEYMTKKRRARNPQNKSVEIVEAPLEIAAPKKDFDMSGMTVENYKLEKKMEIPDPVVLQPVFYKGSKYYLILTAWGEEGYDELVFNEKQN